MCVKNEHTLRVANFCQLAFGPDDAHLVLYVEGLVVNNYNLEKTLK